MSDDLHIDFDLAEDRRFLHNALKKLRGIYRIEITKWRPRRTDPQNRRYWPALVAPFAEFLREQGEPVTDLQAHELLKGKFLRKTWLDKKTGEACDYTRSTTELDVAEFNQYMEQVENWLADFGIIVEEPTHER